MTFHVATAERWRALAFLRQLYPCSAIEDTGTTKAMLDLVEADKIRVQDPNFHSPAEIIPGTHWNESERVGVRALCQAFHAEAVIAGRNSREAHTARTKKGQA